MEGPSDPLNDDEMRDDIVNLAVNRHQLLYAPTRVACSLLEEKRQYELTDDEYEQFKKLVENNIRSAVKNLKTEL